MTRAYVKAAILGVIGLLVCSMVLWLWRRHGDHGGDVLSSTSAPAHTQKAAPPPVHVVTWPAAKERLSDSSFIGTDGRMYSSYDTDGDGLYDAEEIRQYGTQVVEGIERVAEGDNWGYAQIAMGGLQAYAGAKDIGRTAAQMQRTAAAHDFMRDTLGWSNRDISNQLRGIDVTKPVIVKDLPSGTPAIQYVRDGGLPGSWYTTPGTPATQVGLWDQGRHIEHFTSTGSGSVLESTARHITDRWTAPPMTFKAEGGGLQWLSQSGTFLSN